MKSTAQQEINRVHCSNAIAIGKLDPCVVSRNLLACCDFDIIELIVTFFYIFQAYMNVMQEFMSHLRKFCDSIEVSV